MPSGQSFPGIGNQWRLINWLISLHDDGGWLLNCLISLPGGFMLLLVVNDNESSNLYN